MQSFEETSGYTAYNSTKLPAQEAEKKKKYHFLCQDNRKNLSPFVAMVDGILGREEKMVLKKIT
eukprot:12508528-Ditylum_brightwellii.AAC.1